MDDMIAQMEEMGYSKRAIQLTIDEIESGFYEVTDVMIDLERDTFYIERSL